MATQHRYFSINFPLNHFIKKKKKCYPYTLFYFIKKINVNTIRWFSKVIILINLYTNNATSLILRDKTSVFMLLCTDG